MGGGTHIPLDTQQLSTMPSLHMVLKSAVSIELVMVATGFIMRSLSLHHIRNNLDSNKSSLEARVVPC